jgi:hypothetical protein
VAAREAGEAEVATDDVATESIETGTPGAAIEREQLGEIRACTQPGVCTVETAPGADIVALRRAFEDEGNAVAVIAFSNETLEEHAGAAIAMLADDAVVGAVAFPFAPAGRARRRRLRQAAPRLLARAVRDLGIDLGSSDNVARLAHGAVDGTIEGRQLPVALARTFWTYAARDDSVVATKWLEELQHQPEPLIERLAAHRIDVVLLPDAGFPSEPWWRLAGVLATRGIRVVATIDPFGDREAGKLARAIESHRHMLTTSADRLPAVVEALHAVSDGRDGGIVPRATESRGPASTFVYRSRERLVVALGDVLGQLSGSSSDSDEPALSASAAPRIPARPGESILVVAVNLEEARSVERHLRARLEIPVELVGQSGWHRAGARIATAFLDPSGEHSGDFDDSDRAAQSSLEVIRDGTWRRRFGGRPVPSELTVPCSSTPEGELAYERHVETYLGRLAEVRAGGGMELARFADDLASHLRRHVQLLGAGETVPLLELANRATDFRAEGYLQAASGSQRWHHVAATQRARNLDRFAAAAAIDREARSERPVSRLVAPSDRVAVFVSHIQRLGMASADHFVALRTRWGHFPFTHERRFGGKADPADELALWYRAIATARKSVALWTIPTDGYVLGETRQMS